MRAAGALAVILIGCQPIADDGSTFIAFQSDFVDFTNWDAFPIAAGDSDGLHTGGERTVYVDPLPPSGSTSFPIGTIVVKTIGDGLGADDHTFAMAKRGGTYNASGAAGWEWFELTPGPDGTVDAEPRIVWRGITPPQGEGYVGVTGGTCNDCHAAAAGNDFVHALNLGAF